MVKTKTPKYPFYSILTTKNAGHTWISAVSARDPGLLRILSPEEELRIFVKINKSVRRVLGIGPRARIKWVRAKMDEAVILRAMRKSEKFLVNQAVLRNMRLVLTIAKKFNHASLSLEDLLHFGVQGLITAILRFEPARGYKFSTYAVFWIRHSIQRDMCNLAEVVRTPVHSHDEKGRIRRINGHLTQKLGRHPTEEELAEATGIPLKKLMRRVARQVQVFSLNATALNPNNKGNGIERLELQDLYANTEILDSAPHDGTEKSMDAERVWKIAEDCLRPKEKLVLELRLVHGLTLEQVARDPRIAPVFGHFSVSRERIRQLQDGAYEKIRSRLSDHDLTLVAQQ